MKFFHLVGVFLLWVQIAVADPAWWTQPSTQIIQTGAAPSNRGVATVGQLKLVASKAKLHLDNYLPGGAGSAVNALVAGFKPQAGVTYTKEEEAAISKDNYSTLNLGQLKAVAKVFYDRLAASGYDTRASLIANGYPASWPSANGYAWDPATVTATNYALATVGQLKLVFSFDLAQGPIVAPPVFSPVGGEVYSAPVSVSISSATPGAAIRYTTNGTTPTASSTLYTGPLTISTTTMIKAIALLSGVTDSLVTSATYTIQGTPSAVATPTFSPGQNIYFGPTEVLISTTTPGAQIRYTVDNSTPTITSPIYDGPITVSSSLTLKAIGIGGGLANSDIATASYYIWATPTNTVATPTISPSGGTYSQSKTITLATATAGASIYYTTNGEEPTIYSQPYNGPFDLTYSATLRVKAFKTGYTDSTIAKATFVILPVGPPTYNLNPFDYAIITYSWGTTDGKDLDTRTAFVNTDATIDNLDVGWGGSRYYSVGEAPYLNWSRDNTHLGGSESIMVDFESARVAFPQTAIEHLRLRSFWYDVATSGNILVRVQTFLGGTIQVTIVGEYLQFAVIGGTPVDDLSVSTHIPGSAVGTDIDGIDVGTLDYTISSKTGLFKIFSH